MNASEIESNVAALLAQFGVTYGVLPRGEKREDGHVMDAWSCSFTRAQRIDSSFAPRAGGVTKAREEFDYFTGIGHRKVPTVNGRERRPMSWDNVQSPRELARWKKENEKPVAPAAAGVLHSLILDSSAAEQTFDDWCSDFGYDTDSRKALQTYMACQEQATKMRRIFSIEQINTLRDALQEY